MNPVFFPILATMLGGTLGLGICLVKNWDPFRWVPFFTLGSFIAGVVVGLIVMTF